MTGSAIPRAALALAALLLALWFAVMFRNQEVGQSASERVLADTRMSDAEWAETMDDFRSAGFLNPSNEWSVIRASYLLTRDRPAALEAAEAVLRSEPENLTAWSTVQNAAKGIDRRRAAEAAAEIRRLNPPPDRPR
jgi:hypothetical protein